MKDLPQIPKRHLVPKQVLLLQYELWLRKFQNLPTESLESCPGLQRRQMFFHSGEILSELKSEVNFAYAS